jgi:hypothetical protein
MPVPSGMKIVHNPTSLKIGDTEVQILETGKVVIRVNHNGDEYDEVTVSASIIFKTVFLLKGSRRVVPKD